MKRVALLGLVVLLAIAFALWPEDEAPAPIAQVETPTAPAPPEPPPAAAADEPIAEEASSDDEPEPAEPEVLTLEIVRREPCDAEDSPCQQLVPGVPVELRFAEDGGLATRATSGADGTIPLPTLAPGLYEASVVDPALFSEPLTLTYDGAPEFIVLEVSPVSRLELRVVSPSGARVPGAEVELVVEGIVIDTGKTDEGGAFRVERSASGRAELVVRAPGFADLHDEFVLAGEVEKTVSLQRGRAVTVHVRRPPDGPTLTVDLAAGGHDAKRLTLGPGLTEARFTDLPARPLQLVVSESNAVGTGPLLTRQLGPAEDEVTVELTGAALRVHVVGPRPKSGFARGKCCAAHHVELRCDGFPLRRKMLHVPGEVTFPFVPAAPCWVSYDGGPEQRVTPPENTLHTE